MGQERRKCKVDSVPVKQVQVSSGVSLKLCLNLWAFNALSPTLNWYMYLRSGLWMLKIFFLSGLMIPIIFDLNNLSVDRLRISGPILFQHSTASG